jgi:metal-responsive CopG/Arc/MetJ family transcriptional regulator
MSSTIISISLPKPLLTQLNTYCTAEERSKSFCVRKALEKYLAEKNQTVESTKPQTPKKK